MGYFIFSVKVLKTGRNRLKQEWETVNYIISLKILRVEISIIIHFNEIEASMIFSYVAFKNLLQQFIPYLCLLYRIGLYSYKMYYFYLYI